jgi:ribose transport system ATP-binding protein
MPSDLFSTSSATAVEPTEPVLSARGIVKIFPGVRALARVDFDVKAGEVHALCGENGAGKSTLMRILAGASKPNEGTLIMNGRTVEFRSAREACKSGILLVHQEISLVPELTVAENLFLGHVRSHLGFVRRRDLFASAEKVLTEAGGEFRKIDPYARVGTLSFARQQMVEIARAQALSCSVVIFDEPTSSLTFSETASLFETIRRLKARRVAIVYISHKMPEIFAISDRVTVLRDGQVRGTLKTTETKESEITRLMIGRSLEAYFTKAEVKSGDELLRVEGLAVPGYLSNFGLSVRRGEVLGLYGLVGAGRSEAMECVFGVRQKSAGEVFWEGKKVIIRSPRDAIALGIGLVPEDRKRQGLILNLSCQENATLVLMRRSGLFRLQDRAGEAMVYQGFRRQLDIKSPTAHTNVGTLSGGNQQKVALAKWLSMNPKLLILDEPTRGIDVGAKAEIHGLITKLATSGVSVILISSELPEMLGLATRILTVNGGGVTASLDGRTSTEESVMTALLQRPPPHASHNANAAA